MILDFSQFRAALLDVDGTLVDSNEAHARAWYGALSGMGVRASLEEVRCCIGMGSDKLLPTLAGVEKNTFWGRRLVREKKELFGRELASIRALPGAWPLLEAIHRLGMASRIVTSSDRGECEALLRAGGIDPNAVGGIISSSEAKSSKPDPMGIFKALEDLGLPPSEVFYVGDTPYDIEAATAADVTCVALRTGYWGDPALSGAQMILDGPGELAHALRLSVAPRAA